MPDRPLILFGTPELAAKASKHGGPPDVSKPTHGRQVERIGPKLEELQQVIDENNFRIQDSSAGIEPEKTLVFVVNGDLQKFYTAVRHLNHDEECAELIFDTFDYEVPTNDDFYHANKKGEKKDKAYFTAKVYCVLANNRALEELLSLWKKYANDPDMKFPTGLTGLRDVFDNLVDMHFWGITERFEETGILDAWTEDLHLEPDLSEVKCEVELFYRKSKEIQARREQDLISYLENMNCRVLGRSVIDSIAYHALLLALPRQLVEDVLSHRHIETVNVDSVMCFRPVGQSVYVSDGTTLEGDLVVEIPADIDSEPIIALFDGLPQENHPCLSGLLTVDDPDDYASRYPVSSRKHGTSMASLIAHGELNNIKHVANHKIYVRPIMKPQLWGDTVVGEGIPQDFLLIDKIHAAVTRLFDNGAGGIAPKVKVINLSIGISARVFYNTMSPLARLLDWLSYKYRVLFIVSAGNHRDHLKDIKLGMNFNDYAELPDEHRDAYSVQFLYSHARNNRLLSPAESMNALTVGATFMDYTPFKEDKGQLLLCSDGMPSPYNSVGRGLNNSVKPDVLYSGGRNTILRNILDSSGTSAKWRDSQTRAPGTMTAAPFDIASDSMKIMYSHGTSNSTALLTHEASRCYDVLIDVFNDLGVPIPDDYISLLIKAMLVHGAQWGELNETFSKALGFKTRQKSADYLHKFLGYGVPEIERAVECAKDRVTLLAYGELQNGQAHLYDLPLPFDFNREKVLRRLTGTLTYYTPIIPTKQKYRSAQLWYTIEGGKKHLLDSRVEVDWQAAMRGSVQHEIFENDEIVVWGEDDLIQVKVNCRGDADDKYVGSIPYALMVSFEIMSATEIDVYEKIASRIKTRIMASDRV